MKTAKPCAASHEGVTGRESLASIRKGKVDYDGNGDLTEGIAAEIAALHDRLLAAIRSYAAEVAGAPIGYHAHAHPYFFNDGDGDEGSTRGLAGRPSALRPVRVKEARAKDPGDAKRRGARKSGSPPS